MTSMNERGSRAGHAEIRWADRVSQALADQAAALQAIDQLADALSVSVSEQRMNEVDGLLARRQSLFDRIDVAHGELSKLFGNAPDPLAALQPDDRRHLQQQLDRVASTAVEVMSRDAKLQRQLESERDRLLGELHDTAATRQAGTTYARTTNAHANPRFQDEEA